MSCTMNIRGHKAEITFDPGRGMLRGVFYGASERAEFFAPDLQTLRREGERVLMLFLASDTESGVQQSGEVTGQYR